MEAKTIVEVNDLVLSFSGNTILDGITFSLYPNEIHVLLGQNGTGKSSIVKILAGQLVPDSGTVLIDGVPLNNSTTRANIHVIYQNISLFPNLTVIENVFFEEPGLFHFGRYSAESYRKLAAELDIDIDPFSYVSDLSSSEKRLVEFMRAIIRKPRILILDEITAFFSINESDKVKNILRLLKGKGTSILYLTHKLQEALEIADRISVIFDKKIVNSLPAESIEEHSIIQMMTGKSYKERYPKIAFPQGEPLLTVQSLTAAVLNDVNFTLHRGEVLGITGIGGAGKTLLGKALIGALPLKSGYVFHELSGSIINSVQQAIRLGIGYISETPFGNIIPEFNAHMNISLPNLPRISPLFIIRHKLENSLQNRLIKKMHLSRRATDKPSKFCSGGEQQKITLSKWLFNNCDIMIIDEPTLYVDIPSKIEVYNLFNTLASQGKGVILLTSDFSEACGMCDRVLVLKRGQIVCEFSRQEASEAAILNCFL